MPADSPSPVASPRARWIVGIAIVLLALNLRLAVGSIGVLLGPLRDDLGMSAGVAGVLTTVPVLCFAVFGSLASPFASRTGLEVAAAVVLVVSGLGILARAFSPTGTVLIVLSVVALAGAAVGNVVLPALARAHFPDRVPLMSSLYGAALVGSGTLSSALSVPVADAFGGWRAGIGVWVVVAAIALVPWVVVLADGDRRRVRGPRAPGPGFSALVRSPTAWALALLFGSQSAQAYAQFGWLPEILVDDGFSPLAAGSALAVLTAVGIPTTLLLPLLIRAVGDRPLLPWLFAVLTAAGWVGILCLPGLAVLWAVLLGLGGAVFTWALTMIGTKSLRPEVTSSLSGFVQATGYGVAAIGPFGVGLLHDVTGGWDVALVVLAVAGLLIGVLGTLVHRAPVID